MTDRPVTLAAISGAHGVTGEVRLKLFCDSVDSLRPHKSFVTDKGALTLTGLRPDKSGAIARFAEIADRGAAEAHRGIALSVPRSALPPLAEGEYYFSDLVGLPCVSTTGEALGHVVEVVNYGASDIIEIERPDGKRFMVPMRPEAIPEWGERIVIEPAFIG